MIWLLFNKIIGLQNENEQWSRIEPDRKYNNLSSRK